MAKANRTEKTVETHEVYVIRSSGSLPELCRDCPTRDAIMIPPEQAAVITTVPVLTIYRWVEAGLIHYKERPDGSFIVCVKSLQTNKNASIIKP